MKPAPPVVTTSEPVDEATEPLDEPITEPEQFIKFGENMNDQISIELEEILDYEETPYHDEL